MSQISAINVLIPLHDETPKAILEFFKALPSPPDEAYGGSLGEIHQFFLDRLKPHIDNLGTDRIHFTEFLESPRFFEIADAVRPEKSQLDKKPYSLYISEQYANHAAPAFTLFLESLTPFLTKDPTLLGSLWTEGCGRRYRPIWAINATAHIGANITDNEKLMFAMLLPALPDNLKIGKDCAETLDRQGPIIRNCVATLASNPSTEIYNQIGEEIEPLIEKFFGTNLYPL